jgi:hypothetical protein
MYGYHSRVPQIEGEFTRFSEMSVDLGEETTQLGRDIARSIIGIIENKSILNNTCPKFLVDHGFIAGSLGRRTQAQPLDDIDTYLVLDAPHVHASQDGTILPLRAHFSADATPLVDDPSLLFGEAIHADAVLRAPFKTRSGGQ